MLKKIKKVIGYYINREDSGYHNFNISGVTLRGIKGTNRKKVDQDDAWFFELAKNAEHIFDLGSNIGYMSLLAAIQKNNKSILLVDPNPEALARAAQNMIVNGFGHKTKFISAFIGDVDGEKVKFYTVGTGEAGSMFSGHAETAAVINSFYEVEKLTIDTLVSTLNLVPDLIKIDVEGAEFLALNGASKTASLSKTKFFIEMHSPPELPMKENAQLVLNWCSQNNYKAYYLKDAVQLKEADVIASRGKCHLLLLPKDEGYPERLRNIKQGDSLPKMI
ncbi:FkbM family methyltransferase [Flavobacterium terrae]|uniref:Methyltransferase, FkbM family n=1 Tax=Flavobacterium terrae TaxID=415425 RepID=A0A1M6FR04_9FLAO|nr:FkbM family methyltransferase [Flavobacterium terrae]SHJ00083.1 methyltransferase, FkbM family [Flavobacterium terrae]